MGLTITQETQSVVSFPDATNGGTRFTRAVALDMQTAGSATCRRETSQFAMLHSRTSEPVELRIISDSNMTRIHQNNFIILMSRVLVNPIRVKYAKISASTPNALLSNRSLASRKLELSNTLMLGLSVLNTLLYRTLTTTTADTNCRRGRQTLRLEYDNTEE